MNPNASRPTSRPTATLQQVTPKLAAAWMSKNDRNRNVRNVVVNSYARDMIAGNWQITGEAVKFDKDGNLIDGQHRLLAIIKADVPVSMLVVRGVDASAQDVMDTGAKRSAGDVLHLSGLKNANIIAAAARLAMTLGTNQNGNADTRNRTQSMSFTNSEIAAYVAAHPEIEQAASVASGMRSFIDLTPSVVAVAWMELHEVDPEDCSVFFTSLAENATTGAGDPRSTLLKRISAARRNGERLTQGQQLMFVVRAWNAWRRGETLRILKTHSAGGANGTVSVSIPKAV